MEKLLKEIIAKVNKLDEGQDKLIEGYKKLTEDHRLIRSTLNEHGLMLRAILESKEVQRGEIDNLTHRTAKIEGAIQGAAKQVINDLKDVSNQ